MFASAVFAFLGDEADVVADSGLQRDHACGDSDAATLVLAPKSRRAKGSADTAEGCRRTAMACRDAGGGL